MIPSQLSGLQVGFEIDDGLFDKFLWVAGMPFVIFLSAIWFFISLRQSNDLLTLKIFGYSNFKIISIISALAFVWGVFILLVINPITSNMVKYYEKTKSNYSKDTDHLVTINRNGVWIREYSNNDLIVINAKRLDQNYLVDVSGKPWLIDPAVYYGHREADLAMTSLFGGFSETFYSAYKSAFPLAPDYSVREPLYQLYHLLNHLNLFGTGYYEQVFSILKRYAG